MRKTAINSVFRLAQRDERVVFIGSDLSPGLLDEMRHAYPKRYFMEGVSEAHVVGMAAGMALDGFIPYVNTIATFLTRRCYEQVVVDLCIHNLPVRLIANGGGLVYAPLGPTHQAIEDIAIMRALPNMTVVCCADADEMDRFMEASLEWPGPIYIRLAKGGDPVVTDGIKGFTIGKAYVLRESGAARPVTMIATGVTTKRCLDAVETLAAGGIDCRVVHVPTIKPLDTGTLLPLAMDSSLVVTVEEHVRNGGLGSAVIETINDTGSARDFPPVHRLAMPDAFAKDYGGQDDLLASFGLDSDGIAQAISALRAGAS